MIGSAGGSDSLTYLDYESDEIDNSSSTSNVTVLTIPAATDLVVGICHLKNGSTCNVSTWTLDGVAYTSTGASNVNSSDNNGFSRLIIGYWDAPATGSQNATFTANKSVSYFHNFYLYFSYTGSLSVGEVDTEVLQSSVSSNVNDWAALQSGASIIVHAVSVHDNDATAWSMTNSNLTGYTLLEKMSSSNNNVHTQVGYVPRAAGSTTSFSNTITHSDNQSVGQTLAVEFYV